MSFDAEIRSYIVHLRGGRFATVLLCLTLISFLSACTSTPIPQATSDLPMPNGTQTSSPHPTTAFATASLSPAVQQLDTFIAGIAQQGRFSGAVLVARAGVVLLDKGYGLANVAQAAPVQAQTRFRIASVTKQFTAFAILSLQADGKLRVADPMCSYLVSCPSAWKGITIEELLTHRSGIADYYDAFYTTNTPFTRDQIVTWFTNRPLDFTPGTQYRYTNSGYLLLSMIIERISGKEYAAYLQDTIFKPLQLDDTGYLTNEQAPPAYATGYKEPGIAATPNYVAPGLGDGGLYSTVGDLYRWDEGIFLRPFVNSSIIQEMIMPHVTWGCAGHPVSELCSNGPIGYGYGWFIDNESPHHTIGHGGSENGVVTDNNYYPDQQLTVIILSNLETFNRHTIEDKVEQLLISH